LEADPPPDYSPQDVGFHIDEGYKTFAPKNLLVFGDTNWHKKDEYTGWMQTSPLTQWPYYLAFKYQGLKLENARGVTLIFFSLFIITALSTLSMRYGFLLALGAILLLATDVALFNFSRSALFEIAIILFVYIGILLVSRVPYEKPLLAVAAITGPALVAMLTVKSSAILYCLPSILAFAFVFAMDSTRTNAWKALFFTALVSTILIVAIITRDIWLSRIHLNTLIYAPARFLLNPIPNLSTLALLLGYSCVMHLLLVNPKLLYKDLYRLSLTVTVIFTPLILALFTYSAPRYYVPIIPACLLLTIEWAHVKPWKNPTTLSLTLKQKILVASVFIPFSWFLLRAIETIVLQNIPYNIGDNPGISLPVLFKLFPFFLLALALSVYIIRSRSVVALGLAIPLFAIIHIVSGIIVQTNVLTHPSYESQSIRNALNVIIKNSESVAGDWAPFFTAETPIRSFYMSIDFNLPKPDHIDNIQPDYFLSSNSRFDPLSLKLLNSNDDITLGQPILLGTYMDHEIQLYKISYPEIK